MSDLELDLTQPKKTEGERLAEVYRAARMVEPRIAMGGDVEKIQSARIALIEAADALMVEVLNHPAGREAQQ